MPTLSRIQMNNEKVAVSDKDMNRLDQAAVWAAMWKHLNLNPISLTFEI